MRKKKIAFIHNNCKDFRYPVFSHLENNSDLEVDFFLLDEPAKPLNSFRVLKSFRVPLLQDFIVPLGLYSELKKKNYDFIVSTDLGYVITYISFIYSFFNKSKFILWNEQWKHIKHPRRYLTRFFEKIICRKSYKILAFGNKHVDFVLSMGAPKENVIHSPNVVPNLSGVPIQTDYIEFDKNEKYILCLARLIKIKGHSSLIKAFSSVVKKHPEYRLIIAGSGREFNELNKLVEQYNLNDTVYMPNRAVLNSQKFKLIEMADIVVLPSIETRTVEAWGLVVNEAALFKKTIIVSSSTGVESDLIQDGYSGLVFEQNNEVELAKKILTCIDDSTLSAFLGGNAHKLICDYYNIDNLNSKLEICFND